jgi:NAD(P)-dependent dehydrogenase (short-subunit alcohol dehydrogenase family)
MSEIRFENRVAIVTGAGGGLGRAHALLLVTRREGRGERSGRLGGQRRSRQQAADKVVEEIKAAGGQAVASYDGVDTLAGATKIVATAKEAFGKLDILINNAGILRDVSFVKMTEEDWDKVLRVHLSTECTSRGHMAVAARRRLRPRRIHDQRRGPAATSGRRAQPAKLGIVGLAKTLAHEGAKYNIKSNVIAPIAKSRMTETIMPPNVLEAAPEYVSLVAYLCSESPKSAQIYAVGGYVSRVAIVEGRRVHRRCGLTPEAVAASGKRSTISPRPSLTATRWKRLVRR